MRSKQTCFNLLAVMILFTFLAPVSPARAQNEPQALPVEEPFSGAPVCQPDVFLAGEPGCLVVGPAATLSDYARMGILFPLKPLAASAPDPRLSRMNGEYLVVTKKSIPLYASVADAAAKNSARILAGGLKYLAKRSRVIEGGVTYYQLTSGLWIEAGEAGAACCIVTGRFQGLLFAGTPAVSFGWIVEETYSWTGPGYDAKKTKRYYKIEQIVQIYAVKTVNKVDWYMIGPDEWVDRRAVRQVRLRTKAPDGISGSRWIEVDLYDQTLTVYDQGQLVFATLITSGTPPFHTRPGAFQIQKKKELETMSGAFEADRSDFYYLEDVPWTMYYDEARALHGAYWRTRYGYKGSHGCVNLSPGDANWLFAWANQGDWVYVWDPSGETPTDPKFYGPGGA